MKILSDHLLPRQEEEDPAFRRELDGMAIVGLRVIAWISIGANLLGYAMFLLWLPEIPDAILANDLLSVALIGAAVALSYWAKAQPYARSVGLLLLFLMAVGQLAGAVDVAEFGFTPRQFMPVMLAISLMLGLVGLPLKPIHTLALGGAITATAHWSLFGGVRLREQSLSDAFPIVVMVILTAVGVALTVAVYSQRVAAYRARRASQDSLEALQSVQSRLFVSETASSQSRLAAALCHELNSPLGALSSSIATLVTAHERQKSRPEQADKLERVFKESASSGRESLQRLEETVARMKRVTNLDRAEEQSVDLNALWQDTLSLLEEELSDKAVVKVELEPIPLVRCRPQQLAAVFANLLSNAGNAIDTRGTIRVSSVFRDDQIIFEVRDDGSGIARSRLAGLFDPSFRSEGGRVRTTNWSMFVSRGIVTEHGGHIEVESEEGKGTTARMLLPVDASERSGSLRARPSQPA